MALSRRLRIFLRRRGLRVTDAVREACEEFAMTVAGEQEGAMTDDSAEDDDEEGDELARNQDIICPHCGEGIEVAVDLSGDEQDCITDCSVCCRPIHLRYRNDHGRLSDFSVEPS